jgi:hypothetical protein
MSLSVVKISQWSGLLLYWAKINVCTGDITACVVASVFVGNNSLRKGFLSFVLALVFDRYKVQNVGCRKKEKN